MEAQLGYDFTSVQKKWNKRWETMNLARAEDYSKKPKKYVLVELPYPSAAGLHMGHCWNYTLFDAYSRYYRQNGFNVLYPMGWDSFGLPTYNHAIKVGRDPHDVSAENVQIFKRQLIELGLGFDWEREIDTSSPEYYKWTQWIFVQMYEHWFDKNFPRKDGGKGQARPISDLPIPSDVKKQGEKAIKEYQDGFRIAYKSKMPVAWCPKCKTGLANEEVLSDNTHERCGTLVEERELEQWMLRITAYAERLIDDLDTVDFPNGVKIAQRDWIGKSVGIINNFLVVGKDITVPCFTTTPVNYGASFIVVAPEYKGLHELVTPDNKAAVDAYVQEARSKTDFDRTGGKDKTGVFTGSYVTNHVTGKDIPVWVADFVLATVGTGAVQGCPGHDARDFEFAKKYKLPIPRVVVGEDGDESPIEKKEQIVSKGMKGTMVNSDFLNGLPFAEAMQKTMDYFEEKGWGKRVVMYKFHDWVFSRQHYWGEPTPMVYCETCGWTPVPMKDLPVTLPKLDDYKMGEDGSSPLAKATDWIATTCPTCKGKARRETDVMPNWAGSNWYYLRYLDPHNREKLVDQSIASYWMPIDLYYGGQEHVTLHLLYSRFIYKFLYDLGSVPQSEPYHMRRNHGIILGPDNRKMSKSWGNVVNPDQVVSKFGADVVRLYMMFIGPYDSVLPWNDKSVIGVSRFMSKVEKLLDRKVEMVKEVKQEGENGELISFKKLVNRIKFDLENLKFNTIVAALMEFVNENEKKEWSKKDITNFLIILAPFTPYISEEYWEQLKMHGSVHQQAYPVYEKTDETIEDIEIPVMINGKVRARLTVRISDTEDKVVGIAMTITEVQKYLPNGHKKVVYIPGKTVNFVG